MTLPAKAIAAITLLASLLSGCVDRPNYDAFIGQWVGVSNSSISIGIERNGHYYRVLDTRRRLHLGAGLRLQTVVMRGSPVSTGIEVDRRDADGRSRSAILTINKRTGILHDGRSLYKKAG